MKKSLVWDIYACLSKKELKSFEQFLASPFFNSRQDLILLNKVLTRSIQQSAEAPVKEDIFKAVFPGEPFDDQHWRLTLSRLYKQLETFLAVTSLQNSDESEKLLITAFRAKKLDRNFTRSLKKVNLQMEQQTIRNPDYYFTRFQMEYQQYLSLSETGRSKALNLEKVEQYLDIAYISTKLRQACFTLSHQAVYNVVYDSILFDDIMALAQKEPYKSIPPIRLYFSFIILFKTGGIRELEHFKEQLFDQGSHFTREEFRDIYLLSLNFCIKKINENQPAFFLETLDMYKKGLEMELLFENGKLSRFTYNNIVAIALRKDDLLWVEHFIHHYKDYLDPSYRTAAFSLNMARLAFFNKDFKTALSHLQNADYEDLISHMTAKILQLKVYFEIKESDSLDSLLQSMRVFIQRKKRIGYHYQIWKNILFYVHKIHKINPYDKKAVKTLMDEIQKETVLPEREWLLEKVKEIKNR